MLTCQQEKQINVKQFGLAARVTEQMSQLQGKRRKPEQELTLLQVKRKECQRQKTRVFAAQETSAIQTKKITAFTGVLQKLNGRTKLCKQIFRVYNLDFRKLLVKLMNLGTREANLCVLNLPNRLWS